MKHTDFITHIRNQEDEVYLKNIHFPVNIRLFNSSDEYKKLIKAQCEYIKFLCLEVKEGYKKPHGMSSANAGLSFNIIGITRNRNTKEEFCEIMINPQILWYSKEKTMTISNCGSLTLDKPITVYRSSIIKVNYYDETGNNFTSERDRLSGAFTIQHEVDHNNGVLITDYL